MPTLKVNVIEATNLFGADLDGNSNPYCLLKIGEGNQFSCIERTRKIKNTKNPTWKEVFTLNVNNPLTENLFVEVMTKESRGKDNSLGYGSMVLHDLTRGIEKQIWLQLEGGTQSTNIIGQIASHLGKKKEKVNQGKVFLGVTALDFGLEPSTYPPGGQMGQQQGMQPGSQPGLQQQPGQQQPGLQQQQLGQQHPGQQQQGIQQPGQQQPGLQQQGMQQQPGMQSGQSNIGEGQSHLPQQFAGNQPGIQSGQSGMQPGQSGMQQQQPGIQQHQQPAMQQQQPGIQQHQPAMQQPGMQQPGMQQPGMQYPPPSSSSHDPSSRVYPENI